MSNRGKRHRRVLAVAATAGLGLLLLAAWGLVRVRRSPSAESAPQRPEPPRVVRWREPAASARAELPFRLPPGLVAERVAGPPLVVHPMFASFDDRGRLYVAGTSGSDPDAGSRRANPPDVIRRLEDTDGDGRFDTSVIFADRLTYPQGVLWHAGAVYTASPPDLLRLEDTDGDGVADRRDVLMTGFPFTGIADDLHGPCLGPDGRIYWGVGRFDYAIRRPGGPVLWRGRSPLVMRCRPDGGEAEVFCGSLGSPVEMAFTPQGEVFACGTLYSRNEIGDGLRDAIVHSVEGGTYPVFGEPPVSGQRTGDLLPALVHFGVAASSGVTAVQGASFGDKGGLVLVSALYNLHRLDRHVLERVGASFRSRDEPLLTSTEPDFHPTDVLEDADGSLLVLDTGAWFRHCPTSRIDRSDVRGAIYRVRRQGAAPVADPRGLELAWEGSSVAELARRLDDRRFAVRARAVEELARRGPEAASELAPRLQSESSARARQLAIWALVRMGGEPARDAIRPALVDRDPGVRLSAAGACGLLRDVQALPRLMELIKDDDLAVRREAATALGRVRQAAAVPALLDGLRQGDDPFLNHALVWSLIAIADRPAMLRGLGDADPRVRRGALVALDQMEGGRLTADRVLPLVDPAEPLVRKEALRILASHPDWAAEAAGLLRDWLSRDRLDKEQAETLRAELLAFCHHPAVQDLMVRSYDQPNASAGTRLLLLGTMAHASFEECPESWEAVVRKGLADPDERLVRQALAAAAALGADGADDLLIGLARDGARGEALRVEALETVARRLPALESPLFELLRACLNRSKPPLLRLAAAQALAAAPLDQGQLVALADSLDAAGALTLPRLLPAYERSDDPHVGEALVAALGRSHTLRSLSPQAVRRVLRGYPDRVLARAEPLLKQMQIEEAGQGARLNALLPALEHGDPERGRAVFFGVKAACTTCHTVWSQGGHVGPPLTRIGASRSGRDLLEAIVFPSATFARGYEPYIVATRDGRVRTGVLARETPKEIVLVTADRDEVRLPRSALEAIEQSGVSIMPQGLESHLTREELGDLVAFLGSLK